MEEFELSEQCRLGNNRARKELYEQYAGRMLGICLRYTGDRDTAQDLLHDGFIKIFDSFDKFTWRGEGSPAGVDGESDGQHCIAVSSQERCDESVDTFGRAARGI